MKPFRICLVPFPITPLAGFGYFLYRLCGLIDSETLVAYHWRSDRSLSKRMLGEDTICVLFGDNLYNSLKQQIYDSVFRGPSRWLLERMLNFSNNGYLRPKIRRRLDVVELFQRLSEDANFPKLVLENVNRSLLKCFQNSIDPFKGSIIPEDELVKSAETKPEFITIPPDSCSITLPIFKSRDPEEREVIAWKHVMLREGHIYDFQDNHLVLVIGGPPGSGKSTLAATLADEINGLELSLTTRASFSELKFSVECVDLDLATPTMEAVAEARGKDRLALAVSKRPWTLDLAFESAQRLAEAKKRSNLVIADLPGGISEITEIVGALGDVGIIITKDWNKMGEWQVFYRRMGIALVAQIRSRLPDEGLESVVTRYHENQLIAGRIAGLDRVVRSWDSFIVCLAKVLLFDLLPSFIERRQTKLKRGIV